MLRIILLSLLCVSLIWASSPKQVPFKPVKDLGPRIINGEQAVLGQFPWQVAIVIQSFFYNWFCGGTIISEEWILTAGHCVADGRSATVTVGSVRIPNTVNEYSSAELVLHENYNANTLTNDIGLIRITRRLTFNDNVQPIALSSKPLGGGVDITISGWGKTHDANSDVSSNLNYITIRTITNLECEQIYGQSSILDSMVCGEYFGNTVQTPCCGDSGGPVVIDASSNPVHVAVVSFVSTVGCENGSPVGFTRTASYIDWIRSKLGVNGADFTKFSWISLLVTAVVITTIIISYNVQAIDLPSKPLGDGVNITVAGWGVTHDAATTMSRNLNYITIKTITNQACGQIYGQGFVLDDMVCAKNIANSLQSPCKGDAGGPAVTDATSKPVHVAISSFIHRTGCEIGLPVGFTRTYAYIDWIKSKSGADFTKFSWVPTLVTFIVITIIIPS